MPVGDNIRSWARELRNHEVPLPPTGRTKKRTPFVVYWTGVLLKASFVMATSIGLWKLTSMFIMWVHPWP